MKESPKLSLIITVLSFGMVVYHIISVFYLFVEPYEHQNIHLSFALPLFFCLPLRKIGDFGRSSCFWSSFPSGLLLFPLLTLKQSRRRTWAGLPPQKADGGEETFFNVQRFLGSVGHGRVWPTNWGGRNYGRGPFLAGPYLCHHPSHLHTLIHLPKHFHNLIHVHIPYRL